MEQMRHGRGPNKNADGSREMKTFTAVRLEYGIKNSESNFHQTHTCGHAHRSLKAAIACRNKMSKTLNCTDIVDETGKKINFNDFEINNHLD